MVLASAVMSRSARDEVVVGVYRHGVAAHATPVFSHSILLDTEATELTRHLRLAVVDTEELTIYVFGQKLVYMVQGMCSVYSRVCRHRFDCDVWCV